VSLKGYPDSNASPFVERLGDGRRNIPSDLPNETEGCAGFTLSRKRTLESRLALFNIEHNGVVRPYEHFSVAEQVLP
jgi:hypothetical protein